MGAHGTRYLQAWTQRLNALGGVAVTWTQGPSNTKAIAATACLRRDQVNGFDPEGGMGRDTCTIEIPVSQFTSGFASPTSITPDVGDTATISGEAAWVVGDGSGGPDDAVRIIGGVVYSFRMSRERARRVA